MAYYYATAVTDPESELTSPEGEIPPSVRALTYDENLNRFVLLTRPESLPIPSEWSEVDEALIEADYPGLLGG